VLLVLLLLWLLLWLCLHWPNDVSCTAGFIPM
jgi:hypothetical protein